MKNQTKLIHTTGSPDSSTGSIIPPIHLSTVFAMDTPSNNAGFQYGRIGNPTRHILEKSLAELEAGKFAVSFSSGSAAITTLLSTLKSGDQVLCHKQIYEGTLRILKKIFYNFGVGCGLVDMTNIEGLNHSFKKNTQMILLETPTNPLLTLLDIPSIIEVAHKHNVLVAVDNTLATPILQKPLTLDADIVIESLTKSINGHSDVLGGVISTNNKKLFEKIKFLQQGTVDECI